MGNQPNPGQKQDPNVNNPKQSPGQDNPGQRSPGVEQPNKTGSTDTERNSPGSRTPDREK